MPSSHVDKSPLENTECYAFVEAPPTFAQVSARATKQSTTSAANSSRRYIPHRHQNASTRCSSTRTSQYGGGGTETASSSHQQQQPIRPFNPREAMKTDFIKHQQEATFLPFMDEDEETQHVLHLQQQHQMEAASTSRASSLAAAVPPFATNLPVPFEEVRDVLPVNNKNQYQQQQHNSSRRSDANEFSSRRRQYQQEQRKELYGYEQQQQQEQPLQQQQRSSSAALPTRGVIIQQQQQQQPPHHRNHSGNWHNHESHIRLAGPDNTEPLKDNRIKGIPRMGAVPYRNNNNTNSVTATSSRPASAHTSRNSSFIVDKNSDDKQHGVMGPSCGPTYQDHPSNNPSELRKILSKESNAIRRSQRFACTPRGYDGDHLTKGGVLRSDGQTSLTEVLNTARGFENDKKFAPPPVSSAAHSRLHRPENVVHDAFVESAPPSFEEEFQNAWHFGKKKHVNAHHVDVYRDQHVNLLQPWASTTSSSVQQQAVVKKAPSSSSEVVEENMMNDDDRYPVGKSVPQSQRMIKKRPLSAVNNGVRSTSQQFYDKSSEMMKSTPRGDLVNFGEDGMTMDKMKTRMLRGTSTSFW